MIDFRSAEVAISEQIQRMKAEKRRLLQSPLWAHYEKDYNNMIPKLKDALEARK